MCRVVCLKCKTPLSQRDTYMIAPLKFSELGVFSHLSVIIARSLEVSHWNVRSEAFEPASRRRFKDTSGGWFKVDAVMVASRLLGVPLKPV